MDATNSIEAVGERAGVDISALLLARNKSDELITGLRAAAASLEMPDSWAVIAEGSIGRREWTTGSDIDFALLRGAHSAPGDTEAVVTQFASIITPFKLPMPSADGPFGAPIDLEDLCTKIGGDADANDIVTHRMLLLLESTAITGQEYWQRAMEELLGVYLRKVTLKDYRPPRFLLNDIIRFWRTLCVDYEGKLRRASQKWALRNAKLRTSRKMLFAGGLFPVLQCCELSAQDIPDFLLDRFMRPPTERIAMAALELDATDAGGAVLGSYSRFIGRLDELSWRGALENLDFDARASSAEHGEVKEMGIMLQEALERMLFETDLAPAARRYLVF